MTGQIKCFFPRLRCGILQTRGGKELIFTVPEETTDLQGGDRIEFEHTSNGRRPILRITARRRWAETLNQKHRPLINEFHDTVQILS